MKLDILVIAAHPDDAELGCAGTILKHIAMGRKVGVVDLTRGELGTRGTVETRAQEASDATKIMGLAVRENLEMRDGFFENNETNRLKIISAVRKYQPEIVITNAYHDRHPDHGRAESLVYDSVFLAGLSKIVTTLEGNEQIAHRPPILLHFIQDQYIKPDIIVDVTEYWARKMDAVLAYKTQFYNPESKEEGATYIASPEFLEIIHARGREFGKSINAVYGEGFTCRRLLGITDLFQLK